MINEPFFIQENSKKAKLPLAAHNLACEQSDGFQGFGLSRPPSVPVLGRRLSSESIIVINDDNSSRFPLPIQLSQKYFRRKSIPTTFDTKNKENKPKHKPVSEKQQCDTPPRKITKTRSSEQLGKKKTRQKSIIEASESKPLFYKPESQTPVKKSCLKDLVFKSLKKHKKRKQEIEKSRKTCREKREHIKKNIQELNKITKENLFKFKHKVFNPKKP